MYPNIIRTYNISFETMDPTGDVSSLLGLRFKSESRRIIPLLADKLFALREEIKNKIKETKSLEEKITWK